MFKPSKCISIFIVLLLLAQPVFANPLMASPVLAAPTLCQPKITLRKNIAVSGVTYDGLNRLTNLQSVICNLQYSYDALSRRTSAAAANGTGTTYSCDNLNRLSNLTNSNGGGAISTFSYSYDAVGNRLSKVTAGGAETYSYDDIYQLTSVQYPAAAFSNTGFNYDKLGNRTTMTNGAATTYAANNLNQYTQVNTDTLNYDSNGNLTSNNGWTYGYDYENRLISATNGITNASYGYDPFGRRISKTVNGTTTNFVYDGNNLIAEYDSAGTLIKKYVYSNNIDEPVAMINGTNTYYYNRDGLGSVTELTDNAGAVTEKYQYDVFGKTIIKDSSDNVLTQSAIGNRFCFTGRELDSETGLYFYRARMYSPDLGRFLQTDPIGYTDSNNLYQYVSNNPVNFLDPLGLCKTQKFKSYWDYYWDHFWMEMYKTTEAIGRASEYKRWLEHGRKAEANERMYYNAHEKEAWDWGRYVNDSNVAGFFRTLGEEYQFVKYSIDNALGFYTKSSQSEYVTFSLDYLKDSLGDIRRTMDGASSGGNDANPYQLIPIASE